MIKAEDDYVEVKGQVLDIIQEACAILQALRKDQPELLSGIIAGWSETLTRDMPKLNKKLTRCVSKIAYDWIKDNEVK